MIYIAHLSQEKLCQLPATVVSEGGVLAPLIGYFWKMAAMVEKQLFRPWPRAARLESPSDFLIEKESMLREEEPLA